MDTNFKDRLMTEWRELNEKIDKLNTFIDSDMSFIDLEQEDQDALKLQRNIMRSYSDILSIRLKRIYS